MKSISNRRLVPLAGPNFYPTPAWATRALLSVEQFEGQIWEPAAGRGAIAEVLAAAGHRVFCSDLYSYDYPACHTGYNFLHQRARVANIITNPPYNIANAFARHAVDLARRKVALLLRLAFLESAGRYRQLFSVDPPARVWVFSQRLSMYAEGAPVAGGGTTSYGWFVWDREHRGPTELHWIPPGLKEGR